MEKQEKIGKIQHALEELRPYLKADGGDITFVDISEEDEVLVELHGACSNCSMSIMTMKAGVEEAIKNALPSIKSVKAVNMPDPSTATPLGQ